MLHICALMAIEAGSWAARYVYDGGGKRISAEYDYAPGTARGEAGENLQSDFAAIEIQKVWYRASHLGSSLFAVDADGAVISHTVYDPWGNPLTATYPDANFAGIDNRSNYTGYTWDEVLELYFAQNRFYDAETHRFTQEDTVKDGSNWYVYCANSPLVYMDWLGEAAKLPNKSQNSGSQGSQKGQPRAPSGKLVPNPTPYPAQTKTAPTPPPSTPPTPAPPTPAPPPPPAGTTPLVPSNNEAVTNFLAIASSQVGTTQRGGHPTTHSGGSTIYAEWYEGSSFSNTAWCVIFASWCANEAGILNSFVPSESSTMRMRKEYSDMGRLVNFMCSVHGNTADYLAKAGKEKPEYIPKAGDLIFFLQGGEADKGHTGIVEWYDPETQTIHTIEGNTQENEVWGVWRHEYKLDDETITGFGVNGSDQYDLRSWYDQ